MRHGIQRTGILPNYLLTVVGTKIEYYIFACKFSESGRHILLDLHSIQYNIESYKIQPAI